MELNLRQQSLSYLQPAVITAQNQEETAECIVPDSSPDIERVLETCGMVLLRGKECREGSCTVSGSGILQHWPLAKSSKRVGRTKTTSQCAGRA